RRGILHDRRQACTRQPVRAVEPDDTFSRSACLEVPARDDGPDARADDRARRARDRGPDRERGGRGVRSRSALPPGPRDPFMALQVARLLLQRDRYLGRLRSRYGDMFSLRVPGLGDVVVVTDPELIRLTLTGDPEVLEAGEGNEPLEVVLGDRSLLLLDGAEHLSQRKLLLPPFHGANLARYRELIGELADQALD